MFRWSFFLVERIVCVSNRFISYLVPIESCKIKFVVKLDTFNDSLGQVRMANIRFSEAYSIAFSFFNSFQSCFRGKTVISNNQAIKVWSKGFANFLNLLLWCNSMIDSGPIGMLICWFSKFNESDLSFT